MASHDMLSINSCTFRWWICSHQKLPTDAAPNFRTERTKPSDSAKEIVERAYQLLGEVGSTLAQPWKPSDKWHEALGWESRVFQKCHSGGRSNSYVRHFVDPQKFSFVARYTCGWLIGAIVFVDCFFISIHFLYVHISSSVFSSPITHVNFWSGAWNAGGL